MKFHEWQAEHLLVQEVEKKLAGKSHFVGERVVQVQRDGSIREGTVVAVNELGLIDSIDWDGSSMPET